MAVQIATWYLLMLGLGLLNYPVASSLLPKLKSRGYAFSKIMGLLLWGFLYWITNIFQVLPNSFVGAVVALALIAGLNLSVFIRKKEELKRDFLEDKSYIVMVELLFFVAFVVSSILRAMSPALTGTEKPMELAFINAILETPKFPPSDPWLSGYAISYYYFGYLMVALLARISGVGGGVAFNLGMAVWVGLICTAAYGILYDLLYAYFAHRKNKPQKGKRKLLWLSLLAPFFLLAVSNAEGGLEMLHASGAFWGTDAQGNQQSNFWEWLDIQELNEPPVVDFQWIPQRIGGTWWWRASRVISDYDAAGNFREVIDEIPAFTFFLADLHPHVLSIPFFLLITAASLNLLMGGGMWLLHAQNWKDMLKTWEFWISALLFGSIFFLNTWDFPASFGLFCLVFLLALIKANGWSWQTCLELIWKVVLLASGCVLMYLPFFLGFSSQAGGVLPSLLYATRGVQFVVMFLPFIFLLSIYLIWINRGQKAPDKKIVPYFLLCIAGLCVLSLLFPFSRQLSVFIWTRLQEWLGRFADQLNQAIQQARSFAAVYGALDLQSLMKETVTRRLRDSSVLMMLSVFLYLAIRFFFHEPKIENEGRDEHHANEAFAPTFVVLLIVVGCGLCLIPEFFFLVDVFSDRMNTIFKFYFQAWILFSLAGSFIIVVLWDAFRKWQKVVFRAASVFILIICCAYSFFIYRERIRYTRVENWTLDGSAYLVWSNPADAAVIEKLKTLPYGMVAEAVGGSYSGYARIATISGYPTVLGWPGHEAQWRGGYEEIGSRQTDIKTLYETSDWTTAQYVLDQYRIRYVVVGSLERTTYVVEEQKFAENLLLVLEKNGTNFYVVP
jgi:YYY domain-containing protein